MRSRSVCLWYLRGSASIVIDLTLDVITLRERREKDIHMVVFKHQSKAQSVGFSNRGWSVRPLQ